MTPGLDQRVADHTAMVAVAGPRTVLFSAMKNEAPFLLEWVAYHQAIGFDEIVICSNPSNDGTIEVLAALARAGAVRHLTTTPPQGQSPQAAAVDMFEAQVGYRPGDWYLWLDADEFLNVHAGAGTVQDLIAAMGDCTCALINWRIFGANGHARFPGRFISDDFAKASAPGFRRNRAVKTLFRCGDTFPRFARKGIHRPLVGPDAALRPEAVLVGSGGHPAPGHRSHAKWFLGADDGQTNTVAAPEFGWTLAQINHYAVRTPELFALKKIRGRGNRPGDAQGENDRHTAEFFKYYDRNTAEDRSVLRWQAAVTAGMDRLRSLPGVAAAEGRASALVARLLAAEEAVPPAQDGANLGAAAEMPADFPLTFGAVEEPALRAAYAAARVILEYGSGGSTVLAASAGTRVFSVESDRVWAARLTAHLAPISDRAVVHYADIGRTGAWGLPVDTAAAGRFHGYALSVWDRPDFEQPDLVLIDGRFRAACLVAVMLRATRPTTVLFDDYDTRRYYHGVEKLARKDQMIGRMARFTVAPGPIPPQMVTQAIGWFTDPR